MIIFFWIVLSFIVGFIGSQRRIGFFGAFILSLIFSPIIGILITALSKSLEAEKNEKIMIKNTTEQTKAIQKMSKSSYIDDLFKLKSLLDSGLISEEEFNYEKERLNSIKESQKK